MNNRSATIHPLQTDRRQTDDNRAIDAPQHNCSASKTRRDRVYTTVWLPGPLAFASSNRPPPRSSVQ